LNALPGPRIALLLARLFALWPRTEEDTLYALQRQYQIDEKTTKMLLQQPEHLINAKLVANHFRDDDRRYVFGAGSKFNHSCMPNCKWILKPGGKFRVVAVNPILAGEECTISYVGDQAITPGVFDVFERRIDIRTITNFICTCVRCSKEVAALPCLACGTRNLPANATCAKCKTARYCSKECQTKHWPTHKPICARIQ
jgi:SET domain-containing protein